MMSRKLICSISGGVDSAVSALLLKRKGFEVVGVYMRNWDIRDEYGHCQADEDEYYAQKVCKSLDIPLTQVNFVKEYWTGVFEPMLEKTEKGETFNPDVYCNQKIKFNALHEKCEDIFNTKNIVVATGHYAGTTLGDRVLYENIHPDEAVHLVKAVDTYKDQTLFLHRISQASLRRSYFPLQYYKKKQVKKIAEKSEINFTLDRRESIGICFIGKRKFKDFISTYIPPRRGNFVCLETREILGSHSGMFQYTVGQKSGISGAKLVYAVLHRDDITGDVIVVPTTEHISLYSRSLLTHKLHWISDIPSEFQNKKTFRCQLRQNHRYPLIDCTVHLISEDQVLIVADFPLRSLTIGQDAILYHKERCLGGGRIRGIGPNMYEVRKMADEGGEIEFGWYRNDVEIWRQLVDEYGEELTRGIRDCDVIMMNRMNELRSRLYRGATVLEMEREKLEL